MENMVQLGFAKAMVVYKELGNIKLKGVVNVKTIGELKLKDGIIVEIERGQTEQGYVYKDYQAYEDGKGVCYIPELSDDTFTRQDFIDNFGEHADEVFQMIDWQSPFSYYDELLVDLEER